MRQGSTMRQTLSSAKTFGMKWVFPTGWIGGFGLGTCALWLDAFQDQNGQPPVFVKWAFLTVWVIGATFLVWFCRRLKRVQVDDEALYVSNYWSETRIPLTEVSHFTQSYMSSPATVTIHLRGQSAVGQRIVFIPEFRWVMFGTHPIITELQALCDRARGKDGVKQPRPLPQAYSTASMRVIQAVCVFLCLLCIASAAMRIQSIIAADHAALAGHGSLGILYAIIGAVAFSAVVIGIQKRAYLTWVLGWAVLAVSFFSFIITALLNAMRQPPPGCWITFSFMVIAGALVGVYWGLWWKRQCGYFCRQDDPESKGNGK
jgi:hypothetical protein